MRNAIKIAIIGCIVIIPLLSSNVGALMGLGVSPSELEIHNALRGGECEKTVTIFNTGDDAGNFSLSAEGEIKEWIHFYDMNEPTMPITNIGIQGGDKALILVKFRIPEDAASRNYTSRINIQSIPKDIGVEGSGQTMKVQMSVNVLLEVTGTQILAGVVKSITTGDTEVNHPLRINIEFKNTGNVVAKPEIAVKITKDETMVDEFTHSETGVKVESKELIPVEWDTIGKESGDYEANVTVSLGGEILAIKELQFKLLPVGTLSRQGNLADISYEGKPSVGKTLKILATFRNTGEIDTKANFIGEMYVDGDLIDTIESKELLVPVRETGILTAYLKIEKDGIYTVKGHAVYEGKTTETKELSFDVGRTDSEPTPKSKPSIPGFGAIGAAIAIASVMGYLIHRRRRSTR
jgi:hypothetical protein